MARAEKVVVRSAFTDAFASRRCLLLADGFYEWRRMGSQSSPYYVHRPGGAPFAMAGIWQPAHRSTDDPAALPPLDGCAVITRPAGPPVAAFHDRMPVIIAPRHHAAWLDPTSADRAGLREILFAEPELELLAIPVGPHVNSPANDDEACVFPVAEVRYPEQLALFSPDLARAKPNPPARRAKSRAR